MLIMSCVFSGLATAGWNALDVLSMELYPTHLRFVSQMIYYLSHEKQSRCCFTLINRPFSYSEKESQSNDTLLQFVEFSNVHNSDRNYNATRSNLAY